MVKLKVLTQLKFGKDYAHGGEGGPRKVKTVQQIPKILTILSHGATWGDKDEILKKVVSGIGMQEVIDEEMRGDDSDNSDSIGDESRAQRRKQKSKHDMSSHGSGHGSDEDSSIDAEMEEDEEKLYQQIIAAQGKGP